MKKCDHPNLVKLLEVIDDPKRRTMILVLEYMARGEVKWRTGQDGSQPIMPVARVREIVRDTIAGLEYLHHQGIIHRDIKPSNLLEDADGNVKIGDFGTAVFSYALRLKSAGPAAENEVHDTLLLDDRDLAKAAGSPACLAPELYDDLPPLTSPGTTVRPTIFRASSASSARTVQGDRPPMPTTAIDVWALGITTYFLLFACSPYGNFTGGIGKLMQDIPTWVFSFPETMGSDSVRMDSLEGREVLDMFSKLLEKDPEKRITLKELRVCAAYMQSRPIAHAPILF
ncbi:kinase-like protein [Calocera cornea HHB12733]|uniref:Kinase-like protein n=1 Tax=Calocera cornea HHB12733 TaxID=1353952 RepID=A0A165FLR7_9BASI|nr:kinase-like protein [Calocera cornea HHB12733]